MMDIVKVFENTEFGQVRAFTRDGEPWFVASDVAKALGYAVPKDAVAMHCKYAELFRGGDLPPLEINPYGVKIIPEADVYALIFRSKLEKAERFRDWVFKEVLPAIRKTGSYSVLQVPLETPLEATEKALRAAGLASNQIALGMSNTYRKITGIDVLVASEMSLPAPVQKQALTPAEIGQELGDISARQVNKLLLDNGYQEKRANGKYDPTDIGKPHALLLDTTQRHNCGTPVIQLKWYTTILPIIRGWLE